MPELVHVAGWFDTSARSVITAFHQLDMAASESSIRPALATGSVSIAENEPFQRRQYLVIGPWTHGGNQHVRTCPKQPNTLMPFKFDELVRLFAIRRLKELSVRRNGVVAHDNQMKCEVIFHKIIHGAN